MIPATDRPVGPTDLPHQAAAIIRHAAPGFAPRVAIVLGSGLGPLADRVDRPVRLSYAELPGFPRPTVEGHAGRLALGRLSGVPVAVLSGRSHGFEGLGLDAMAVPVRTMKLIGCGLIYLTCAAGGLHPDLAAGRLMTITDHLNLMDGNPLSGPNDDRFGPRFPDMVDAYHPALRQVQRAAARALGIDLAEGVYAARLGPAFETPAEVRMIRLLGADAVGMSVVPECLLARHCGLAVTATAVITNRAAGLGAEPVSHAQTLQAAEAAATDLARLMLRFLDRLAATGTGAAASPWP